MRDKFIGFYQPTEKEVDKAWNEGVFAFDANTLLNLYRYTEGTRNDFLAALQKLQDRLYMPYQVGFEFHKNRHSVIEKLKIDYSSLMSGIKEQLKEELDGVLGHHKKHPTISAERIYSLFDTFLKNVSEELNEQEKHHPDFNTSDSVLELLSSLYDGKVGDEISEEKLKEHYKQGKIRYDKSIPPGYKDLANKKKKGDRHVYGDYIIWKEIIEYTKENKKPLVFITDDRKEDWWTKEGGKTIRPREELIKEFYDETGVRILIYHADSFLHFAKVRNVVSEIREESITEVQEIRESDEAVDNEDDIFGEQNMISNISSISKNISDLFPNLPTSAIDAVIRGSAASALTPKMSQSMIDAIVRSNNASVLAQKVPQSMIDAIVKNNAASALTPKMSQSMIDAIVRSNNASVLAQKMPQSMIDAITGAALYSKFMNGAAESGENNDVETNNTNED